MTALIQDRKTDKMNPEDSVFPLIYTFPIADNVKVFGGSMVATDSAGRIVPAASTAALKIVGRCERFVDNTVAGHTAGALNVDVRPGAYYLPNSGAGVDFISVANRWQLCFMVDDNVVALTDGGGTRPAAGIIIDVRGDGQVCVGIGAGFNPMLYTINPEVAVVAPQYHARNVVSSLQAYTGTTTGVLTETANGAWVAQDGVTNVVGDVVFIQAGTTNLVAATDSGPWQITNLGTAGTKWVLTRPDWWAHASVIQNGQVVDIGGEGPIYAGAQFKSFAAVGSAVVDANDPTMFIKEFCAGVTLVTGFATLTGQNVLPGLRSLTKTAIVFQPTNFNGGGLTVHYVTGAIGSGGAATATGAMGTSSISITALIAAGTFNTNDIGTGNLSIYNW